jgi:hypothetical protein
VQGKITFDGQPLTEKSTVILLKPDATKGNQSIFEPTGSVDAEGNFAVVTKDKHGAPPGWYKVIVTAYTEPPVHPDKAGSRKQRPVAQSLLPSKYGQVLTTDLALEVVENPPAGAYDLKLSK